VRRELAEPALARMRLAINHRGPDDRDTVFIERSRGGGGGNGGGSGNGDHPVGFAHTRLAIIDTSAAGRQPMRDESGSWITFNGEIYNFAAVGRALQAAGRPCHGRTDTEVILRAYAAWGPDSVNRLRGMFAWALADPAEGTVWLCRDRLGIKPLYIARPPGGGLLFASEVRALLAAGPELVPPRVSATAVESFLAQGMVCGHESVIEGVRAIPQGTSLLLDWDGRERVTRQYWHVPFEQGPTVWVRRSEAIAKLGQTLREAVDCHLISDVPLGLFLSGGVDSSAVATIATEVRNRNAVRTLAMGLDERSFDESADAAKVASELGTEHRNVMLTGNEMLRDISEVFDAMDQPTVDGFNTYFVSRAARRAGLTVALSGIGGDELFGGYGTFRDVPRAIALARWAQQLMGGRAAESGRLSPTAIRPPIGGRGALKLSEMLTRTPSLLSMYLLRRELFLSAERRALHARPRGCNEESGMPEPELGDLGLLETSDDVGNTISAFELSHYLRYMLLRDADVFSMAVGLEVRVPFLDHLFVETAAPLPGRWKRNDGRAKPLLLDAVGPRLPGWIATQRKRGFAFPWRAWLVGPLRARAHAALSNRDVWRTVGLAEEKPEEMWFRFLRDDARVGASQIIALWVLAEYAQAHTLLPPQ
jgi:asparagine synthase (glutamine-hydrolysing)